MLHAHAYNESCLRRHKAIDKSGYSTSTLIYNLNSCIGRRINYMLSYLLCAQKLEGRIKPN